MARPKTPITDEQRALLRELSAAQQEVDRAVNRRDELALTAASSGIPWVDVGAAMGTSPQTAHHRFRHRAQTWATDRALSVLGDLTAAQR